jgi:hypothetical protein
LERPSKDIIQKYLQKFSNLFEIKLGIDIAKLAEEIEGSNFSDIEEMTKEIIREYVLSLPNSNLKSITNYALKSLLKKNNRT